MQEIQHRLDTPSPVLDMIILRFFRTCPHRVNVRIFRHNFVGGKAKIRRRAVALQGFLTQSPAIFDEKTCMDPYVDWFLVYKYRIKVLFPWKSPLVQCFHERIWIKFLYVVYAGFLPCSGHYHHRSDHCRYTCGVGDRL